MNFHVGLRDGDFNNCDYGSRWWEPATEVGAIRIQAYCLLTTHLQPLQFERQPFRTGSTLRSD